ncbi:hypothetical protein PAMP_006742 [Pampus punctatissimus]
MRLRERCRTDNSDMVSTQIDKDEDRVDCSVADTSPTRHRNPVILSARQSDTLWFALLRGEKKMCRLGLNYREEEDEETDILPVRD